MSRELSEADEKLLLNQKDHPAGTRLLLTQVPSQFPPIKAIETEVLEWSPSGKFVHLRFADKKTWYSPRYASLMQVEILPPKGKE